MRRISATQHSFFFFQPARCTEGQRKHVFEIHDYRLRNPTPGKTDKNEGGEPDGNGS